MYLQMHYRMLDWLYDCFLVIILYSILYGNIYVCPHQINRNIRQYTSCLIIGKKWYHRYLPSWARTSFFAVLLLSILVMQLVPKEGKYSWLRSRNLSYCRGGALFLEMYNDLIGTDLAIIMIVS